MKTPQQIKNEVEKGCGEWFDEEFDDCLQSRWICGKKYLNYKTDLCPKCKAKLSILTEYDKSIKEMIEEVAGKCCKSWNDTEQLNKDLWVITESDEFTQEQKNEVLGEVAHLIGGHLIPDILSKIGDNSEVKE